MMMRRKPTESVDIHAPGTAYSVIRERCLVGHLARTEERLREVLEHGLLGTCLRNRGRPFSYKVWEENVANTRGAVYFAILGRTRNHRSATLHSRISESPYAREPYVAITFDMTGSREQQPTYNAYAQSGFEDGTFRADDKQLARFWKKHLNGLVPGDSATIEAVRSTLRASIGYFVTEEGLPIPDSMRGFTASYRILPARFNALVVGPAGSQEAETLTVAVSHLLRSVAVKPVPVFDDEGVRIV